MGFDKKVLKDRFFGNREYYEMMADYFKNTKDSGETTIVDEMLIDILGGLKNGSRVLDMGCGSGSPTVWFANKYPSLRFTGTDASEQGISIAKEKGSGVRNVDFFVDDVESSSMDFIFSVSVLEHLTDYRKALSESYRILRKGGKLMIRVGNPVGSGSDIGIIKRTLKILFKANKPIMNSPNFDLSGSSLKEKTRKHQTNFDLVEIPADVLARDLKKEGFRIIYFSTRRDLVMSSPRYVNGSWITKRIIGIYVKMGFFPFKYMGPTTMIVAEK